VADTSAASLGARKLASKGSQSDIARRLGVTQQAVSSWISGRSQPSGKNMLEIANAYRIPMSDWLEPAEGHRVEG
jgi:transcriptional regulator with XRE-family HTH domain